MILLALILALPILSSCHPHLKLEAIAVDSAVQEDLRIDEDAPLQFIRVLFTLNPDIGAIDDAKFDLIVDGEPHAATSLFDLESRSGEIESNRVPPGPHQVILTLSRPQMEVVASELEIQIECCHTKDEYLNLNSRLEEATVAQGPNSSFVLGKDVFAGNIPHWTKFFGMHGFLDPKIPIRYLELGTWEGRSAIWTGIATMQHPESRMITVDIMQGFYKERFLENKKRLDLGEKLDFMNMDTVEALSRLIQSGARNSFDVIYVDASHDSRSTLVNTLLSWELLREGGVMIWDDYGLDGENGPQKAVDTFWSLWEPHFTVLKRPTWENWQPVVRKTKIFRSVR